MVDLLSSVGNELAGQVWHYIVALAQSLGDNLHAEVTHGLHTVIVGNLVLVRVDVKGRDPLLEPVSVLHIKQVVAFSAAANLANACLTAYA